MDIKTFGQYFDHALLKAQATRAEFEAFCTIGIEHSVKMLAINPAAVIIFFIIPPCEVPRNIAPCGVSVYKISGII